MERATASIDVSKLATSASTVHQLASTIDFDKISLSLAVRDHVFHDYDRLSANSALVGETLASVIARNGGVMAEFDSATLSALRLAVPEIPKFDIASSVLVGALSSTVFAKLATADRSLGRRLVGLSDSYRDIFTGMAALEIALPDFVIDLPAHEMIVKSTIISSRAPDFEPADAEIDLDDPTYARADVDLMLAELNPQYVSVIDEAFAGQSLGRVRHLLVSLREIIGLGREDLGQFVEKLAHMRCE